VTAYAQELNDESYAVCKADMLIKGQNVNNVIQGNTLSDDKFSDKKFDWMLSNPPYGVDWKKIQGTVEDEHQKRGSKGRFGPGLPRISDGQMLFLMHLVSKMQPPDKNPSGSRDRYRHERLAALQRRCGLGGVGDPEIPLRE
jgi:type I restriction enzyme M protein